MFTCIADVKAAKDECVAEAWCKKTGVSFISIPIDVKKGNDVLKFIVDKLNRYGVLPFDSMTTAIKETSEKIYHMNDNYDYSHKGVFGQLTQSV